MSVEGLPTLWLPHHTREPHLLRDGDDGTEIRCIYQSVAHGIKTADARVQCMTMDDPSQYTVGGDFLLRFNGERTPESILTRGFRARMSEVIPGIQLGELTDEQVRAMGYKTLEDLIRAKQLRYPLIRKMWEPESLTVAHMQFEVLEELENLNI